MRRLVPSSRGQLRLRFATFDTFWAALAPLLALYMRGALILRMHRIESVVLYCAICLGVSLISFMAFRLHEGMAEYFSVHDAFNVVKACCVAGVLSTMVLFTITRLDGIPRSTPLIELLTLASGLITFRAFMLARVPNSPIADPLSNVAPQHIILIGATRLSAFYIKFMGAYAAGRVHVMAILDDNADLTGRTVIGIPVVATVSNLAQIISEFKVHGVNIDRIVVGGDEETLSYESASLLDEVATAEEIELQYVPQLVGLSRLPAKTSQPSPIEPISESPETTLPRYHEVKRLIDFILSTCAILILSPLFLLVSAFVFFDIGMPISFWQQRVGCNGKPFLLYKFRTLRPPFDRYGRPIAEDRRLSWVGKLLRRTRLDELAQLFNVAVGDMSLIGPRPLLPHDQPANASMRLAARPGITGWAQVNGGNLISIEEKGLLDAWYVHRASFWLDLRIVWLTLRFLFIGERRSESAIAEARRESSWWPKAEPGPPLAPQTLELAPRAAIRMTQRGNRRERTSRRPN